MSKFWQLPDQSTDLGKEKAAIPLWDLLGLGIQQKQVVSLVGAGGKTTLMFTLAHELVKQRKKVVVATTTHIFWPAKEQCAYVLDGEDFGRIQAYLTQFGLVTVGRPEKETGKLGALSFRQLQRLEQMADVLLVEADGARCLPIKVPNQKEPVLPPSTTCLIAVAGLTALGRPIEQICHRAALAQQLLQVKEGHILLPQDVQALLWQYYGHYPFPMVFALNQADSAVQRQQAKEIASALLRRGAERVLGLSLLNSYAVCYTRNEKEFFTCLF